MTVDVTTETVIGRPWKQVAATMRRATEKDLARLKRLLES
jgi:hypothetical protein